MRQFAEKLATLEFKTTKKETIDANAELVASICILHCKDIERSNGEHVI
ncbi:hypothetical protein [Acinetobacter junii]|uniref:Uncharacterized protein n=1 Tax=Acinetobacter junii TaxID=40215 RepID=A0A8F6MKM3_ACIJU|nr:hypothetical protein [Acinetobacter junii]MDH1004440.1 hypothetical protein [Acinetobacter junii]QXR28610.1 hypothetical protein EGT69_004670 [Acinetobacter junii]